MGLDKSSGLKIGKMPVGNRNLITDVPGVTVGHVTVQQGEINTGVTAILPHGGNLFRDKVMGASCVVNGFGKCMGLVQLEELGTIETPIIMTNTLCIGIAATSLIKYMLAHNPDIGVDTGTVNPLVCECNDGHLNDIRGMHITEQNVLDAIKNASPDFEEGAVGSGTGMSCMGFKGGIGSSSRVVKLGEQSYTVGALVMSNFGSAGNLLLNGDHVGERIEKALQDERDKGSIMMIVATDVPLSERQLKRVAKRAGAGLARTGSIYGNGSGDIAIAFTTANRVPHYAENPIIDMKMVDDEQIDPVFRGTAEAVEEAIISSLYHAKTTEGRAGHKKVSLKEYL